MKNKIKTYIIGTNLKNLVNVLNNKKFFFILAKETMIKKFILERKEINHDSIKIL